MDALEALLRPIVGMANRQIRAKTPARELCRELAGRVVALRVRDTGLAMYFHVGTDSLDVRTSAAEPDVVITASLFTLASLAGGAGEDAIRSGSVELTGDVGVAQRFQRLLAYGKPDLEEELSAVVGDVAAHGIGEVARSVGRWSREARTTMRRNLSEYLQEESRVVPSRNEFEAFRDGVNVLRDDVERASARLRRLEAKRD